MCQVLLTISELNSTASAPPKKKTPSSKKKYDLLKREFIDRDIVLINEYRTTDEARKLYFQENPPKGWKKLIPLGMQVPPVPVDDYAAIVIGRKYLKDNK